MPETLTAKAKFQKKDMPVEACFECSELGRTIFIEPKEEETTAGGQRMHKPGTGYKVKFRGGKLRVGNKALLQVIMEENDFRRGIIFPDREDPTGFWRTNGVVQTVTKTITVAESTAQPDFKKLKFSKIEEDIPLIDVPVT